MSIKVDDMYIRVLLEHLAEGTQSYQMLTSYHEGNLAIGKNGSGTLRYLVKRLLGTAYAELDVTAVKYADVLQVTVLPGTVSLQTE